jgi:hypothetical protein
LQERIKGKNKQVIKYLINFKIEDTTGIPIEAKIILFDKCQISKVELFYLIEGCSFLFTNPITGFSPAIVKFR